MTDTPKPLVPLYPYQCQRCEGKGRIDYSDGYYTNSMGCGKCKELGVVWLPTPHPDMQSETRAKLREVFHAHKTMTQEAFSIWMANSAWDWSIDDYEGPYSGPLGVAQGYSIDGSKEANSVANCSATDEPYTKGGD